MCSFPRSSRPLAATTNVSTNRKVVCFVDLAVLVALLLLWQCCSFATVNANKFAADSVVMEDENDAETTFTPEETEFLPHLMPGAEDEFSGEDDEYWAETVSETSASAAGDAPRLRGGGAEISQAATSVAIGGPAPITNNSVQLSLQVAPQIVTDSSAVPAADTPVDNKGYDSAPARTAKELKLRTVDIPFLTGTKEATASASAPASAFFSSLPSFVDGAGKKKIPGLFSESSSPAQKGSSSSAAAPRTLPSALSGAFTLVNNPLDVLHTLSRGVSSLPSSVVAGLSDFNEVLKPKGTITEGGFGVADVVTDLLPLKGGLQSMLPNSGSLATGGGDFNALAAATDMMGRGASVVPEVGAAAAHLLTTAGGALNEAAAGIQNSLPAALGAFPELLGNSSHLLMGEKGVFKDAQHELIAARNPNSSEKPQLFHAKNLVGELQPLSSISGALNNTLLADKKLLPNVLDGGLIGESGVLDLHNLSNKLLVEGNSGLDFDKVLSDSARIVEQGGLLDPKLLGGTKFLGDEGVLVPKILQDTRLIGKGGLLDPKTLSDNKLVGEGGYLDPKRLGNAASSLLDGKISAESGQPVSQLAAETKHLGEKLQTLFERPLVGDDDLSSTIGGKLSGESAGLLSSLLDKADGIVDPSLLKELSLLDPNVLSGLLGVTGANQTPNLDAALLNLKQLADLTKLDSKLLKQLNVVNSALLEKIKAVDPKVLEVVKHLKVVDPKLLENLKVLDPKVIESLKLVDPKLLENLSLLDPALLAKLTDPALLSQLNLADFTSTELRDFLSSLLEMGNLANLPTDPDQPLAGDAPVASFLMRSSRSASSPSSPGSPASTRRTSALSPATIQRLAKILPTGVIQRSRI